MKNILGHILVLLGALLAAVGCTQSGIANNDSPQGDVSVLDLSVSIADGAVSKAPIEGTSFADGTHLFGLAVTQADELTAYAAGSNNVWSRAVISGVAQTWTYRWGSMSDAGTVLPELNAASVMHIAGYYPYNASAIGLVGRDGGRLNVPFDLTTDAEQRNQTDVLFSTAQALTYVSGGGVQRVPLLFRHVYALLEFQVKLSHDRTPSTITKVEVRNKAGKEFLSNQGFFSPYTGALTAQTAGDVSVTTATELDGATYATIQVMVPPTLLAGYQDGDIYVQLYDEDVSHPKEFPILLKYLTSTGDYGFAGGGRYRFKLLYDNRGTGSLTVEDWFIVGARDEVGSGALTLSYDSPSAVVPVDESATSVTFTVTGSAGLTVSLSKTGGDGAFSDPVPATLVCDGSAQTVTVTMLANTGAAREALYSATVTTAGVTGIGLSGIAVKQNAASTVGLLVQDPLNVLPAAGVVATVSSPNATAGLVWSAALSNTAGFALGSVTGVGALASVPVTVGLNPTNVARSSTLTATATNGLASSLELTQAAGALTYVSPSATTPVDQDATSVTFTVTGTAGLTLSFAKLSGDADFSVPADLTCDGTAQTVTVTMAATTGGARQAVYTATVTNPGASGLDLAGITVRQKAPVNPPAASDYVKIDKLYWTKGNLVSKNANECKVGAAADCGVYFQLGSLVGWNGGASGNGVGTGSPGLGVQVKPAGYNGLSDWATVGYYKEGTENDTDYNLPLTDAPTTGVGDPCRYYLGGAWRTPTAAEYATLDGLGRGDWVASSAGRWFGVSPGTASSSIFFPASGFRSSSDGSISHVRSYGYYWSSSVYTATASYYLGFRSSYVVPQDGYPRSTGMPVRCVSPV